MSAKFIGVASLPLASTGATVGFDAGFATGIATCSTGNCGLSEGEAEGVYGLVSNGASAALTFSPDGTRLATSSRDRTVRLWDVESGINVATLLGHRGWVTSLEFAPDGSWLASGSNDKSVVLWETARSKRRVRAMRQAIRSADRSSPVLLRASSP